MFLNCMVVIVEMFKLYCYYFIICDIKPYSITDRNIHSKLKQNNTFLFNILYYKFLKYELTKASFSNKFSVKYISYIFSTGMLKQILINAKNTTYNPQMSDELD